jgi:hypothetical protein
MKKVGIITLHYPLNYGSALQTYALQQSLRDRLIDVEIINYLMPYDFEKYKTFRVRIYKNRPQAFIADILYFRSNIKRKKNFEKFHQKYLHITEEKFYSNEDIEKLNSKFDGYICGSDQIWNFDCTNGVDKAYFLDFAADDKLLAAYAPSMAQNNFNFDYEEQIKDLLKRFDFLSVREESSRKLVQGLVDKPVKVVCDPTFLLPASSYRSMSIAPKISDNYIFVYMLEYNEQLINYANWLSEESRLPIRYISNISRRAEKEFTSGYSSFGVGPEEFLGLIDAASYIVTNSFHATIFSILMHKQFVVFKTQKSYPRLVDLLQRFDLSDRIFSSAFDMDNSINYLSVDQKVCDYVSESSDYLEKIVERLKKQ